MKKIALILPFAAAFAATPAYAQGISISPRVELKVGYDSFAGDVRLDDSAQIERDSKAAIGVGIEAGVDANISEGVLVGVYGGHDFPRIDKCGQELFLTTDEFCIRNKSNWTLGARVGARMGDGGVVYVKGGHSITKVRLSYDANPAVAGEVFNESDKTSGWHVGGGIEVPLSGGVYFKGEYVYTRYKKVLEDALAATDSIKPTRHQVLGGIGIRFGN